MTGRSPKSVESRLGAIEAVLRRADEDRVETGRRAAEERNEMNRKMDALDTKFDTVVAANGETAGAVRQLAQSVESGTRTMERLSSDDCGNRLKRIEGWAESVDKRLERIEQSANTREARLERVESGVEDFRKLRKGLWNGVWQLALAAVGGGGIVKLIDHWLK